MKRYLVIVLAILLGVGGFFRVSTVVAQSDDSGDESFADDYGDEEYQDDGTYEDDEEYLPPSESDEGDPGEEEENQ